MSKLSHFLAGAAVGYVLGARAGKGALRADQDPGRQDLVQRPGSGQGQPGYRRARPGRPSVADLVSDAAKSTAQKLRDVRSGSTGDGQDDLPPTLHRGTDVGTCTPSTTSGRVRKPP